MHVVAIVTADAKIDRVDSFVGKQRQHHRPVTVSDLWAGWVLVCRNEFVARRKNSDGWLLKDFDFCGTNFGKQSDVQCPDRSARRKDLIPFAEIRSRLHQVFAGVDRVEFDCHFG